MNDKIIKKELKKINPQDGDCLIVFKSKNFDVDNNVIIGKKEALVCSYAYQMLILCEKCDEDLRSFIKEIEEKAIKMKKDFYPFEEFV